MLDIDSGGKSFLNYGEPIEKYQDDQAFDKLYEDRLEILAILHRAIRDGEKGYKRAIHQIMEICQRME